MATTCSNCYTIACDQCGDPYENSDGTIMHASSDIDLTAEALGNGWHELPADRLLCEQCARALEADGVIERVADPDSDSYTHRVAAPTRPNAESR